MQHDVALLWLGLNGERRPHLTNDTVIKYEVACEDQPVRQGEIVIPLAQIDRKHFSIHVSEVDPGGNGV
jgi:hypothetical protein